MRRAALRLVLLLLLASVALAGCTDPALAPSGPASWDDASWDASTWR